MARENNVTCGGGGKIKLRKGPWTLAEDEILTNHVMRNGEKKWSNLLKKGLLMRRGQSCRSRWHNNLSANIKKGDLTPEEERKILSLHAEYGNRWSILSHHLPGRTDNEIKNYWTTRSKKCHRDGLPLYPPEIQQEIKLRAFNYHLQTKNQVQLSPSMLSFQNPKLSSISSSLSSANEQNPNFRCINQSSSFPSYQTNMASSLSSSFIRANSDFSRIDYDSPIDPERCPVLFASLQPNMINLHSDNDGRLPSPLPTSYISQIDQSKVTSLGSNPIPRMDDSFLSENCKREIPSIQSSFQAITPTSCLTNMNNHFVVLSNDEDCSNHLVPELFSERNNGFLEDIFRKPRASLNLQSKEDKQSMDEKCQGRIRHNDFNIMNDSNNNVNYNLVSAQNGNYMTFVDASSSGFSSTHMGVKSQVDDFEDLNMTMSDDDGSWLDIPPDGLPEELTDHFRDDANMVPTDYSIETVVATAENRKTEVLCSPVSVPSGNDMTFVDDSSSGFLSNDMGVTSKADYFKDINMMMIDDNWQNWGWIDYPPAGPSNDAIIPIEQDHVGSGVHI